MGSSNRRDRDRTTTRTAWVVAMLAIACLRCGGGSEPAPLRVGVVGAPAQGDVLGAADLAVREVDSVGGIDGRVVETPTIDVGNDFAILRAGVTRMIDEGVVAIVGAQTSATTLEVADLFLQTNDVVLRHIGRVRGDEIEPFLV